MKVKIHNIIAGILCVCFANLPIYAQDKEPANMRQSAKSNPITPRAVLIGIDAAGWYDLLELIGQSRLPNIEKLIRGGSLAKLTNLPAGQKEQWLAIATGVRPALNGRYPWWKPPLPPGLNGYTPKFALRPSPGIPMWEVLSRQGVRSGVSGWEFFSDHKVPEFEVVFYAHGRRVDPGAKQDELLTSKSAPNWVATTFAEEGTKLIRPSSFEKNVQAFIRSAESKPDSFFVSEIPILKKIRSASEDRYLDIKYAMVSTEISTSIAKEYIQNRQLDFVGSVIWGLDPILHRSIQLQLPQLKAQAFVYIDTKLGDLLAEVGNDDYIVLVSNHSVINGRNHNEATTDPFLAVRGPGVSRDTLLVGATVLDVAPTILGVFGCRAPPSIEGRALDNLFSRSPALRHCDHHTRASTTGVDRDSEFPAKLELERLEEATLKRMRSIGYFK